MSIKNPSDFATKKDVYEVVSDATDKILQGVQMMFDEQDKKNEKKFTTKEDLKRETGAIREEMATKEDLKREVGWLRDDINGLKADLANTPTRKEFNTLQTKVGSLTTS